MESSRRTTLLLAAVIAVGAAPPAFAEPPPIEAFFEPSTFQSPRLSPSGRHIAVIYYREGQQIILVRELAGDQFVPIAKFPGSDFRLNRIMWATDDRLLVSGARRSQISVGVRARATFLFGVDRDGENFRYLAKRWPRHEYIQIQDDIIHPLPDEPKYVLISLRMTNKRTPAVYRMNVHNGSLRSAVSPERHIWRWYADASGVVRVGIGTDPPNSIVIARIREKDDFEKIADFHVIKEPGISFVGFTKDPATLLVATRRSHERDPEGDRNAVFEYSLETKQLGKLVLSHDRVDVWGPIEYEPGTNRPVAISYYVDQRELHFLDESHGALQRGIDKALPGRTNQIVGNANDGKILLVESWAPNVSPETYVILREVGEATRLMSSHPALEGVDLGEVRPIRYTARDGLEISGYLTLPPASSGKGLPAVVMPHGGPTARDVFDFDRHVLFLASRGYAVLQMNYRGSSGFGAAFESAGYKRWGMEMQDDITDGAAWLVSEGIADPKRMCIFGASYGGYAALMASVKTPDVFRCAASYAGVFDLIAENRHDKRYVGGGIVEEYRGKDRDLWKAASPIHNVDRIQIPILLGHGEDDPNVHMNQSKRMAKALRKAGKDVDLVLYDDEIHGWQQEASALDFAARLEAFLADHLDPASKIEASAAPSGAQPSPPTP